MSTSSTSPMSFSEQFVLAAADAPLEWPESGRVAASRIAKSRVTAAFSRTTTTSLRIVNTRRTIVVTCVRANTADEGFGWGIFADDCIISMAVIAMGHGGHSPRNCGVVVDGFRGGNGLDENPRQPILIGHVCPKSLLFRYSTQGVQTLPLLLVRFTKKNTSQQI